MQKVSFSWSCARKIVVTSKSTFFGEKWQLQAKKSLVESLAKTYKIRYITFFIKVVIIMSIAGTCKSFDCSS